LIEEISTATDDDVLKLLNKLDASTYIHSTHFVKVRLFMRVLQSDQVPATTLVKYGDTLLHVLAMLGGEGSNLYTKYLRLVHNMC